MHIVYLFIIAFVNSIDNIGIGVAYSIGRIRIGPWKNFIISSMAFLVSYISSIFGSVISNFLDDRICTILSISILIIMGSKMIVQSILKKGQDEYQAKEIKYSEVISIGLVLALDDVGSSISSGLAGYSPFAISFPYFVISIIIFALSDYGRMLFGKLKIGRKATIISGAVMILMGLLELIG